MTKRVVDFLESVDIKQQQGALDVVAQGGQVLPVEVLFKPASVHQPGQRIVIGQVAQLLLGLLAVGDVAERNRPRVAQVSALEFSILDAKALRYQLAGILADDLVSPVAEDLLGLGVDQKNVSVPIDDHDRIR